MHRMRWPAKALASQQPEWTVVNLDARAAERYSWAEAADLLVIFQSSDLDLLPVIQKRKSRGLKTLVEYNDNFYESPAWGSVGEEWASPLLWQSYELFMRLADGIIVTGKGLQEMFAARGFNDTHIIENHFPLELEPFSALWPQTKELRIGWAGSLGHIADLLAALPVLRKVVLRNSAVKLCLMGNESIPSYVRLPQERFEYVPWGGMDEYFGFLKSLHIGAAPLLNTAYNACRSDVKAIEMGGCGVLPVVTARNPYKELLSGFALPSFSTWSELEACLAKLVADPDALESRAREFHRYISGNRMLFHNTDRAALYRDLMPENREHRTASDQAGAGLSSLAPGYHEIGGDHGKPSPFQSVLASAAALNKTGRKSEAVTVLQAAAKTNPCNHHLRYQVLRSAIGLGAGRDLKADCEQAIDEFPLDLRFILLRLQIGGDESNQAAHWENLIEKLTLLSRYARKLFVREILAVLVRERLPAQRWLQLTERLRSVFPDSLDLLLAMAEAYDSGDQPRQALALFEELESKVHLIELNGSGATKIKLSFVQARAAALRAGLREEL